MKILENFHLTYCSNIHAGETWDETFSALEKYLPEVKQGVSPDQKMGVGLRLSAIAAQELLQENRLEVFNGWLNKQGLYVYTLNGFPYGGFHHKIVKDNVHVPDWLTNERVSYTKDLFTILTHLLPDGIDGGISTSPLSYKPWYKGKEMLLEGAWNNTATNVALIALDLFQKEKETGKVMHLDIEPEPDGFLENSKDVINFFDNYLLKTGADVFASEANVTIEEAKENLLKYIQVCYDVCHFALAWEDIDSVVSAFERRGIKIGKIQISAALEARFNTEGQENKETLNNLLKFSESTYLHQVSIKEEPGNQQKKFEDLGKVGEDAFVSKPNTTRVHFHVPVFVEKFEKLYSTQKEIVKAIEYLKTKPVSTHLEVETYTWEVLPEGLKADLSGSIIREVNWVKSKFVSN